VCHSYLLSAIAFSLDPGPLAELHERFRAAVEKGDTPGLCYAVLRHGQLVASGAFGVADTASRQPWGFDTICRLFSMTKTVAVCGLMALVEDGCVSLDDPIAKFLPAFEQSKLRVVSDENSEGAALKSEAWEAEHTSCCRRCCCRCCRCCCCSCSCSCPCCCCCCCRWWWWWCCSCCWISCWWW
ncbi:unnamed protein product, partial [Polarella glacialis]